MANFFGDILDWFADHQDGIMMLTMSISLGVVALLAIMLIVAFFKVFM